MYARIFILFLCIITFSTVARADTFTVTSNADSGSGTLREALNLAAANGSTVKDYIYFNIADQSTSGRTIALTSTDLPSVTSNIVIDATTQPGIKFGVSDAKVKLTVNKELFIRGVQDGYTAGLHIANAQNIEIYGLYIADFDSFIGVNNYEFKGAGITIIASKNIKIGAPGKGNVFFNNYSGIITGSDANNSCSFIEVKSNFVQIDIDGKSPAKNYYTAYGLYISANNFLIGGDLPAEGNYIGVSGTLMSVTGDTYRCANNRLGITYFDQPQINEENTILTGHTTFGGTNVTFDNNVFSNMLLEVNYCKYFRIYNNSDRLSALNYTKITLYYAEDGIIGSDDITKINHITGTLNAKAIVANSSKNIRILKNSIVCSDYAYDTNDASAPKIKVLVNNDNELSGTATANSTVYIYEDNKDCEVCNPVTFYTNINADASGNWKIIGSFKNKKWVVNTTWQQASSEFTQPKFSLFFDSNTIRKQPNCGKANGYLKTTNYRNIINIKWFNENDEEVGQGDEVSNLKPGKYYAVGYNGNCSTKSPSITLYDNTPYFFDNYIKIKNPSCNEKGSITNLILSGVYDSQYTFTWKDAQNNIVSDKLDLENVDAGVYSLFAKVSGVECEIAYGPITLKTINGPSLNQTSAKITPSNCSNVTGSITGIIANATNPKFSWKNESQTEVGTSIDLLNQPPGKYILTITDDSNCGPVISDPIIIPALNDIAIITTNKQIQKATCDNYNGAITGITATGNGTLTYKWTNEQDQLVGGDLDLMGVGPGKYKLTVTSGACSPVSTDFIEISSINGVSLNTTNVSVRSQTACAMGQITGLSSPDATSFTWRRKNSTDILSSSANLLNVPAGDYELTIANAACTKAIPFSIAYLPPVNFSAFPSTSVKSCQAFATGSIVLNTSNAASQPIAYRWVDQLGQNVGFDKKVANLAAGKYKLFVTDYTGCETSSPIQEVTIDPIPAMAVTFGAKHDIYCGVGKGSIDAPVVSGGRGSYIYIWKDASGNAIAPQTKSSLTDLAPGNYSLEVLDKDPLNAAEIACNSSGVFTYHIEESTAQVPAPMVNDKDISYKGNTILAVENPYTTAIYRLYDSETAATPIDEQQGGKFSVNVSETRSYWVSLTYGSCQSARTKVTIKLLISTGLLPNAFTPNGDGINDTWMLANMDINIINTVKVFNRNGQAVFESRGYTIPFDGNYNGKQLAAGVYYYIIDLKKGKPLSGHVTIIR